MEQGLQNKNMDVLLGGGVYPPKLKYRLRARRGINCIEGVLVAHQMKLLLHQRGPSSFSTRSNRLCKCKRYSEQIRCTNIFFQDNWNRNTNNHACAF
jgi:hypothetical protein